MTILVCEPLLAAPGLGAESLEITCRRPWVPNCLTQGTSTVASHSNKPMLTISVDVVRNMLDAVAGSAP